MPSLFVVMLLQLDRAKDDCDGTEDTVQQLVFFSSHNCIIILLFYSGYPSMVLVELSLLKV